MERYKRMYTGKGIGVAVLDTGIFPHIDFGSRISVFRDFTGSDATHMMITDMGLMSAGSLQGTELHQEENIKGLHLDAVSLL